MNESTKRGLQVLGAALLLGFLADILLRPTPFGLNSGLWVTAAAAAGLALARCQGVRLTGGGRWLIAPGVLFAFALDRKSVV